MPDWFPMDEGRAVALSLIRPGIITGSVLALAKAMGEFGASITFASSIPGQTLPPAIYSFPQAQGGRRQASGWCWWRSLWPCWR